MNKIKMLIADDIDETRNVIRKMLSIEKGLIEIVGEASNGKEVIDQISSCKPDVVLMDINMPIMNGLEATEEITNRFPGVIVIIMSVQAESEYLKRAMFSGAKEYIIKPFNYEILVDTIKVTYDKYKEINKSKSTDVKKEKDAKVISFYSSKGGVGKSVLSINSAIILSEFLNKKTLLIDIDLQFGDVSMLINKHEEKNIIDIVDDGQLDNYENMKEYLYKYNNSLDILFAPKNPESAEYISKDIIEKIILNCKQEYDVIIVDTGVNFNESTLYILDESDLILFTTSMEIVSLKNTKLALRVMNSLNYDKSKVKIVINSVNTKFGINIKDIKTVFNEEIFQMIPEDIKNVRLSVNKGVPFCDNNKNNNLKITKSIRNLCKKLIA